MMPQSRPRREPPRRAEVASSCSQQRPTSLSTNPATPRPPGIVASNLRRIDKNTLRASVDLDVPAWHPRLKGCLWHVPGDNEWINFPSREWLKDGERQFADLIEITDRSVRDRFQRAALDAVHGIAEGREP